ncbi:MAG: peptide chain release factor 2 [Chloroflexi bacterium]|jgi:peptide chain release factor 2|uniref:peptide chain release factor 2 n=1 Tax=Candidatus Flexifilum breve TaxID=3140694 RepID=UPI0031367BE8|nr:peptide chain release factor 2 [Chloroflexota bacterium]
MEALNSRFETMRDEIDGLMQKLDLDGKQRRADQLQAESADPDFWSNPEAAQKTMQEIARLNAEIDRWNSLKGRIQDALELASLEDPDLVPELLSEANALAEVVEKMSLQVLLSGPYDSADAILAIHAGAGGTEAQDWAEMLERMFLRWAEANGYKTEIIERMAGEEAGIKSVMIGVRGEYAYGYLQSEQGVHRLVRISPYDAAARRHTSFAKIELWPDIQGDIDIEINEKDLRIDTYRSSGAGGQNVQKNETAIRILHIPTNTIVTCQNQRSLTQNRERAMQILKSRLFEMERKKREAELSALKGENVEAGWGNQIRSYVLQPYQQVKDLRTGFISTNPALVLSGELNDFMVAYLRAKVGSGTLIAAEESEIEP